MKKTMMWKGLLLILILVFTLSVSTTAQAEWNYGIGTGLMLLNFEGDVGLDLNVLGTPAIFDLDLDPDDVQDLMETAFGFGGFATNGTWKILYSFATLELADDQTVLTRDGLTTIDGEFSFTGTSGEIVVAYPVSGSDAFRLHVYTGARYTNHELSGDVVATGAINGSQSRDIDESWVDALIGIMADVPLADKWAWNTRVDGGFGGSEGTYMVNTGVSWRIHRKWSASLFGKYTAVEFENAEEGDADWYLYDVDESGVGLNFLYLF